MINQSISSVFRSIFKTNYVVWEEPALQVFRKCFPFTEDSFGDPKKLNGKKENIPILNVPMGKQE